MPYANKQRPGKTKEPLLFDCHHCGRHQTVWVNPDWNLLAVVRAHGWECLGGDWKCPDCSAAAAPGYPDSA